MTRVNAPWSEGQVQAIQRYQERVDVHPFTCPNHSDKPLWPCSSELYCRQPGCPYIQQWVHHFMCKETTDASGAATPPADPA